MYYSGMWTSYGLSSLPSPSATVATLVCKNWRHEGVLEEDSLQGEIESSLQLHT
jgi:hypothetical protein